MSNTDFDVALTAAGETGVAVTTNEEAGTLAEPGAESATGSELKFEPMEFVNSLQYMGKGMLGILIVMGAIILVTSLLNRLTSSKQASDGEEEN